MNTVKILHCADLHIGAAESFLGERAEKRRYETLLTFERIIDIAEKNGTDAVLIAGDLFDSNTADREFTAQVLGKIASVPQVRVIFAAGNHDPLTGDSPFSGAVLPDNFYILDTKGGVISFEDIGLNVYGQSYSYVYMDEEPSFSPPRDNDGFVNIMLIHGELKGDPSSHYCPISSDFIANSNMDYIALGHIHKRTEISKLGNTFYAYSGCPEGQGFDETGEKGVYIGTVGKGVCDLEFLPVAKRMHVTETVDISDAESTSDAFEKIISLLKTEYGENYGDNLYKLILAGSVKDEAAINTGELFSRLSEKVYFVKLRDKTEPFIDKKTLSAEVSLKGIFVKNMLAKLENADENEKARLEKALELGIRAFSSEVSYNED